ncbi:hypothetical protein F4604DRAFT_1915942 [Suillus subluteus]|nr:hypothetical protein F4604DRAFT_1915942 [Suillus subluteus]
MEPIQPPVTRGRGKGRTSQGHLTASTGTSGQDQTHPSKFTVQWQADPQCTEKVMEYLCAHTADCHVLFYLDNKSHANGDHPSAKGKLSICQIITKHVFKKDSEYSNHYHHEPEKFCDSMDSHISGLGKTYCKFHDKLHSMGAGVTPFNEMTLTNLHMQIMEEFCWYDDLASILGGNPAVSLKTILSVPGADHAANYFSLVQWSTAENHPAPPPSAQLPPPGTQLPSSTNYSGSSAQYGSWAPGTQPSPPNSQLPSGTNHSGSQYGGYVPSVQPPLPSTQPTPPVGTDGEHYVPYSGYIHPGHSTQPYSHLGQQQPHLPLNHKDGGMDYGGNNNNNDLYMSGPITDLNSPPKHKSRHKRQLPPSSPSPPLMPPPHSEFMLPEKLQTTFHNSRAAFGAPDPTRHQSTGSLKPLSGLRSSHSQSPSTSTGSVMMSMTPTSQSAASDKGKGRPSKKAQSDMLSQVDIINDEIRSIQSERLNKENEHQFLHTEHQDEHMDAATIHQRSQEAKGIEIRLCEAKTKKHELPVKAHAKEAALLRLKIEYCQLTGGS